MFILAKVTNFSERWGAPLLGCTLLLLAGLLVPLLATPGDRLFVAACFVLLMALALWYSRGVVTGSHRLVLVAALLLALVVRLFFLEYTSADYSNFLQIWMMEFKQYGGIEALRYTSSNYNLPYLYFMILFSYIPVPDLYLLKILSIVFDMVLAFTLHRLAWEHHKQTAIWVLVAALLWPSFIMNSAIWGQCDSIYVSFCLLSMLAIFKNRPKTGVLLAGLALAFKLQAIFYIPLLLVFLIARRVKWRHAFLLPVPYVLTALPTLLYGWTPARMLSIYTGQVQLYSDYLTLNAPSVFAFFPLDTPKQPLFTIGIALAGVYILGLLIHAFCHRDALDTEAIILYAFLIALGLPWLLPAMHDRYFYLAEALVLLYVALRPKQWPLALLTLFASLGGYYAYLVQSVLSDDLEIHALAFFVTLVSAVVTLIRRFSIKRTGRKLNTNP